MKRLITTTILLLAGCTAAMAQYDHPNSKARQAYNQTEALFGKKEIDSLVIRALTDNMPGYYNAPGLPRFTVIGKERKYYFGVGGYAKATVSYDWGNPIENRYGFAPSSIPTNQPKGNGSLIQFGAGESNISFNFVGLPETPNSIGAYFNFNFFGPNYQLKLLNAYVRYRGFTIGYDQGLFSDVMAGPPTIDFAGPNSWTFLTNTVLDYQHNWGKHWGAGIGLEMPVPNFTNGTQTYAVNQRVPDIPFYLQYSWDDRNSWVRFSGIIRNMLYRDEVADKNVNNTGWGVQLSGSASLTRKLTMFYQGVYGYGISNYIQDTNGEGLDMLPSINSPGKLDNVEGYGAYLGLQYNFNSHVYASATYSIVGTSAKDAEYAVGQYKDGQYVVANVFWNIAPQIQIGAEYLWGDRKSANGQRKSDSRLQAMFQFNF